MQRVQTDQTWRMPKRKADFCLCWTNSIKPYALMLVNQFLIAKLLNLGKIRKAFSKFYHTHSVLIVKYNIGLKTLLKKGISELVFYGDLVYIF